jgi:D-alanyl-D-alanine carboxypeptidase
MNAGRLSWPVLSGLALACAVAATVAFISATGTHAPSAGRLSPHSSAGVAGAGALQPVGALGSAAARLADSRLDQALASFIRQPDAPPGIAVLVQRGNHPAFYQAGTADLGNHAPMRATDWMRLGGVSMAFSGAVALWLVGHGTLALDDTVGRWLPSLPVAWHQVTLRELLDHTSGIPDFSLTQAFRKALQASPHLAPSPRQLLSYAPGTLDFRPGSRYAYSNSDNIVVALMAQAASGRSYTGELRRVVSRPLGLGRTSLPRGTTMPRPRMHGYALRSQAGPQDVTGSVAAGWSWASVGIVSTPLDANVFIRAYVSGAITGTSVHAAQYTFRPGSSEPPGPGQNAAGLAIFRYRTACGTVYGHTGEVAGYTQFAAANASGTRSVVVSVNAGLTPAIDAARFAQLRQIYALAVCAALS